MIGSVISDDELPSIDKPELLAIVQSLRDELAFKQMVINKITHEMAVLKRLKFAAKSEPFSP
jgi:transposase